MIYPLILFRIVLALTAWIAILYDNYRHRDLKLVAYAYTFLVLGSISAYFYSLYLDLHHPLSNTFLYFTHISAALLAGIMFALTAYAAHQHMNNVEEKTKKAFKGRPK